MSSEPTSPTHSPAAPPSDSLAGGEKKPNTPKRKLRGMTQVLGGVGLLAALLTMGILPRVQHAQALHAEEEAESGETGVTVVTPIHAARETDLTLPGSIEPVEQTAVNARTSGYVRRWYVDIGDRVKAGQLLAEIESPEVDQQLSQARAEAAQARANLEQAKAARGTQEAAVEQAKAEAARLEAAIAQATADAAKAQATFQSARAESQRANAGVTFGKAEVAKTGANLEQAKAALARQQAALAQSRQVLLERKAHVSRTRTELEIARKTWERWRTLVDQGAVSGQEADEKRALFESRQADLQAALAAVSSAEANVQAALAAVEATRADVQAAQATISSSQANVEAAVAGASSGMANVDAVHATVQSSQANIEAARAAWRSSLAAVRAAQQRVEAAASQVRSAEAALSSAEANVRRHTVLQSFQKILAPFDGVVTSRNVDTGTLVNAGTTLGGGTAASTASPTATTMRTGLFGIARSDMLRIQVNVPQSFVPEIKAGQKARIAVKEFPRREFAGVIAAISGALDPASRTMLVEVRLPNRNQMLVPGMYAQVTLAPAGASRSLQIPATTLIHGAEGPQVAVVASDGKVQFRSVQLGQDLGAQVEVTSGLSGGEELIESPGDGLVEGAPVRVVREETEVLRP